MVNAKRQTVNAGRIQKHLTFTLLFTTISAFYGNFEAKTQVLFFLDLSFAIHCLTFSIYHLLILIYTTQSLLEDFQIFNRNEKAGACRLQKFFTTFNYNKKIDFR